MRVRWYNSKSPDGPPASPTAERNIETMLKLEEEFLQQRSWAERIADTVARLAGSLTFISLHLAVIVAWVLVNTGMLARWVKPFDPFPFNLLAGLISLEGVMLAAFVLIKQNRMGYRSDHRSHLDLQVNLLAEQEATKILQMLLEISKHLGIQGAAKDAETVELATSTPLEHIARDLDRKLRSGETDTPKTEEET